jgi:hypothetical protein
VVKINPKRIPKDLLWTQWTGFSKVWLLLGEMMAAADEFSAELCRQRHLGMDNKCDERHANVVAHLVAHDTCLTNIKMVDLKEIRKDMKNDRRELDDRMATNRNYFIAILVALVVHLAVVIIKT